MAPMDAAVDVSPEPYIPAAGEGAAPKRVTILGSTGSIGCNTIDLISRHPAAFEVEALTAQRSVEQLAEQARAVGAKQAVIGDPALHGALRRRSRARRPLPGRDARPWSRPRRRLPISSWPGSSAQQGSGRRSRRRARRRHRPRQQGMPGLRRLAHAGGGRARRRDAASGRFGSTTPSTRCSTSSARTVWRRSC